MRKGGLYFLFTLIVSAMNSCANDSAETLLQNDSPAIEVTVAENREATHADQQCTRQVSGGFGDFSRESDLGFIATDNMTGRPIYGNTPVEGNTAYISRKSIMGGNASFTAYAPYSDELEFIDNKGTVMIPFDMTDGSTPQISETKSLDASMENGSVMVRKRTVISDISISIREIQDPEYEYGHIIIKEVSVEGVAQKGFYVFSSFDGEGHWENQRGRSAIRFTGFDNTADISFNAIPETAGKNHIIKVTYGTEDFDCSDGHIGAIKDRTVEYSLAELLQTNSLEQGNSYSGTVEIAIGSLLPTIGFSSTVSEWIDRTEDIIL